MSEVRYVEIVISSRGLSRELDFASVAGLDFLPTCTYRFDALHPGKVKSRGVDLALTSGSFSMLRLRMISLG